jgi:Fe-S-cluster containining protein
MPSVLDDLPALYRSLLPALGALDVPAESKATCANCAMAPGGSANAVETVDGEPRYFRADAKCCTYHPRMPNFLVGALLADPRPELAEGQRRMRARIASHHGVTPQWLRPPGLHQLMYDNARRAFGRALTLRCPFFAVDQANCTIWPFRESVCSTYFCRYQAGEDGRAMWTAIKRHITLVEANLSRWALWQHAPELILDGAEADKNPTVGPDELDGQPLPAKDAAKVWGRFAGREEELYQACFESVRSLSADDVERVLGFDSVVSLAEVQRKRESSLHTKRPAKLKFNPATTVKWMPDGTVALGAYSELEAVALPGNAYGILLAFDGRDPVMAVRERLRSEYSVDVDDALLDMLYHHRVMIEP